MVCPHDPKEESFDPKFFEAIGFEEDNEYQMDMVIRTVRNGYRLGEKLYGLLVSL